jgi:GntR family transcriptional regulator
MKLRIDPAEAVPIWSQIEEGVRRLVAATYLAPGAAVPSVRDMARELRVNPATVSKAYQRLTEAGILEVRRGEGTFVASAPPSMARGERSRLLQEAAGRYAAAALTLGATREETLEELRSVWAELVSRRKGGER